MRPSRRAMTAGAGLAAWWAWRHANAPMVAGWSSPAGERRRAGELSVRTLGTGGDAVILLHGLTASGNSFGGGFDALANERRLVVPDLLGFGATMDVDRSSFGLEAHLDALDTMAGDLAIDDGRWIVGGHSMGGILALHWAARHAQRVERVVTWGAPLHRDRDAAIAAITKMGTLERIFVLHAPLARGVCTWMCEHRRPAAWMAVAVSPDAPVALARQGVLHTWPAYRDALEDVVLAQDWSPAMEALVGANVPVAVANGASDPVPDHTLVAELAASHAVVDAPVHSVAAHELPVAYPDWCVALLTRAPAPSPR